MAALLRAFPGVKHSPATAGCTCNALDEICYNTTGYEVLDRYRGPHHCIPESGRIMLPMLISIERLGQQTPQVLRQSEGRWPRICARSCQAHQQSEVCHVL